MAHITATATPPSNIEGQRPTAAPVHTSAQDADTAAPEAARSPEQHQAAAIADVCALAANEPDPTRRGELLALAQRALAATQTLHDLIAEHQLRVEEWDTSTLNEKLRRGLMVWHGEIDGQRFIIVPKGQTPVERLHAVHTLLTFLARQEVTA